MKINGSSRPPTGVLRMTLSGESSLRGAQFVRRGNPVLIMIPFQYCYERKII